MSPHQRETALRLAACLGTDKSCLQDQREAAALLRSLAEEVPEKSAAEICAADIGTSAFPLDTYPQAKQEPLTEEEIDGINRFTEWPANSLRNIGDKEWLGLFRFAARAIESACAKKWGVSLG